MRRGSPLQEARSTARQFDLFAPASIDGDALPEWQTLPEQTRQTLMGLLTRLIVEHAGGDHCPLPEEATS